MRTTGEWSPALMLNHPSVCCEYILLSSVNKEWIGLAGSQAVSIGRAAKLRILGGRRADSVGLPGDTEGTRHAGRRVAIHRLTEMEAGLSCKN